jgi:hypothetical protein
LCQFCSFLMFFPITDGNSLVAGASHSFHHSHQSCR